MRAHAFSKTSWRHSHRRLWLSLSFLSPIAVLACLLLTLFFVGRHPEPGFRLSLNPKLRIAVNDGIESEPLRRVAQKFSDETGTQVEFFEFPYDNLYEQEMCSVSFNTLHKQHKWEDDTRQEQCQRIAGGRFASKDSVFDVIFFDDPWFEALLTGDDPENPKAPRLAGVSQLIDDNDKKDFFPSTLRVSQHPYCAHDSSPCKSQYYAIPFVGNSQLFCYRPEAFKKAPGTWGDVVSAGDYATRVGPANSIVTDLLPIIRADDGSRFSPVGRKPLDKGAARALEMIRNLGSAKEFGTQSMDDFDLAVYMAAGEKNASIIWSAWAMAMANLPDSSNQISKLIFGDVPGTPLLGAWLLAAPSNGHAELAKEFMKFATSKESLKDAARYGNPPPRKSVLSSQEFRQQYPKSAAAQWKSLDNARPRPRWPDWKKLEARMGVCFGELTAKLITAEEALNGINSAISSQTSGSQCTGNAGMDQSAINQRSSTEQ